MTAPRPAVRRDPCGLLVLLALLAAGPAGAEAVVLRGGEHPGFTRLVLRGPEAAEGWALRPAPGGLLVEGPEGAAFDWDGVFGRIGRARIGALEAPGEGRLAVTVACDCHATLVAAPGLGLVLDVIDGPAGPGAVAPGPAHAAETAPPAAAPAESPTAVLDRPAGDEQRTAPPLALSDEALSLLRGGLEAASAAPRPTAQEATRVAQTEAAVLAGVAEAARHGFLDLAPGAQADPGDATVAEGLATRAAQDGGPRTGLALRDGGEEGAALGARGAACLPPEELDLAAWAGSGVFAREIPARLAALSDARDRVDPEAAEALARTYLAFGFGREAAVALDLDGGASRARDTLRLLARLLDGEGAEPGALDGQASCLGPVTLWRALARGTLGGTQERERIAAMLALRDLPEGARTAVALRVAGLFLDAGDAGAADEAAALGGEGSEALLARAEIAGEIEGPAQALVQLEALAEGDARMTPEAMVELLDLLVSEGRPVGEDTLALARALRFENGGSRALLLAEGRALTAEGRFEEALTLLDGARREAPGEDVDEGLAATAAALSAELEDAAFLELALSGLSADLPPPARDVVARRLADLGFPGEAWALRAPQAVPPPPLPAPAEHPTAAAAAEEPAAPVELPPPHHAGTEAPAATEPIPPEPVLPEPVSPEPVSLAPAGEATLALLPPPEAGPGAALHPDPDAPPLSEPPPDPSSLAARRDLLAQAAEARERAEALLGAAPTE